MELKYIKKLLLFTFILQTVAASVNVSSKRYTNYLKTACDKTRNPQVCFKTLSPHTSTIKTDDLKLCTTAVSLSLKAATETSSSVATVLRQQKKGLRERDGHVVGVCIGMIDDSIYGLKKSLKVMANMRNSDGKDISEVEIRLNGMLTGGRTCTDELDEFKVRSDVKKKVADSVVLVMRMIRNAFDLINNKLK